MSGVNVWLHLLDNADEEMELKDTTWFPALPRNSEWIEVDGRAFVVVEVRYKGTPIQNVIVGTVAHVYARVRGEGSYPVL